MNTIQTNDTTHIIDNKVFLLRKKSKWTWEAVNGNEHVIATAQSKPKLRVKLDELYGMSSKEQNTEHRTPNTEVLNTNTETPKSKLTRKSKKNRNDKKSQISALKSKRESKDSNKNRVSKKDKPESMRAATLRLILEGKDDSEILKYVQSQYSNVKYNMSHVKWYRSNFAKTGLIEAEFAPRNSEMYREWSANSKR